MRSLYQPPKPKSTISTTASTTSNSANKPPSTRPQSRQSDVSITATTISGTGPDRTVRKKVSATILTRTRVGIANRSTATPTPNPPRVTPKPTTTTAPARSSVTPRPALTSTRPPLRPRDHNVAPLSTRNIGPQMRNLKATPTTMPSDKDPPRKPPLPTLAKGGTRAPITPKLAPTRSTANLHQPQTVTVATTPLPRRAQRPESALSNNGPNSAVQQRDDFVTPVSSFLHNNITPRSGSRQSRVDSRESTPSGTPMVDRGDWDARSGLGLSPSGLDERLRQASPFVQADAIRPQAQTNPAESKFFYASEARQAPQPAPVRPKAPGFFYASGGPVADRPSESHTPSFTPILATPPVTTDSIASKFVYANGVPEPPSLHRASTYGGQPSGSGSVISTASRPAIRPASTIAPHVPTARPVSPVKLAAYAAPKAAPTVATNRSAVTCAPQYPPAPPVARRVSGEVPARPGHSRAGSLVIADPPSVARILSSVSGSEASSPASQSNPTVGFASILQAAEEFGGSDDEEPSVDILDEVQSPTKSTHQHDDLIVNARRERKVQDLEITNASLEAINRSLERQLRKQKTELRQYRRLSRTGRLSLPGKRIVSGSTVEGPLEDPDRALSDLSEEESEPEEEEEEYDSEFDDSDLGSGSSSGSPGLLASRDARHRKRDEKRLRLDLSKHQQLLIDSQKINQSLKRCLGWTEELIKEGKKALEFQVKVSEVEIGGRVLRPEEEEEDTMEVEEEAESQAQDSKDPGVARLSASNVAAWGKGPQDRDSGIEMRPAPV